MAHAGDTALPDVGRFSDDPCRSHTLPGSFNYAPGVFELEKQAIFNRTWQYVCHLSRVAEPGRVHPEYHSHSSRGVGESTAYARSMDTAGEEREFGSWLLWPNFALEVYPGGYLNVFHHEPTAPERTVQRVEWYFPTEEPTPEQREVIEFVDAVRNEDVPICESVQRGLHSLGYTQGRLVATANRPHFSEHAVHDFQAKVLKALRALPVALNEAACVVARGPPITLHRDRRFHHRQPTGYRCTASSGVRMIAFALIAAATSSRLNGSW